MQTVIDRFERAYEDRYGEGAGYIESGFELVTFRCDGYGVDRFTVISKTYPNNGGAAIGVTLAAGDLGNAVLPVVASAVATAFAWQFGLGFAVPLFALVAVSLWFVVPKRTTGADESEMEFSRETARYVLSQLRRPPIIVVTLILVLGFSLALTLTGFYPTYLI